MNGVACRKALPLSQHALRRLVEQDGEGLRVLVLDARRVHRKVALEGDPVFAAPSSRERVRIVASLGRARTRALQRERRAPWRRRRDRARRLCRWTATRPRPSDEEKSASQPWRSAKQVDLMQARPSSVQAAARRVGSSSRRIPPVTLAKPPGPFTLIQEDSTACGLSSRKEKSSGPGGRRDRYIASDRWPAQNSRRLSRRRRRIRPCLTVPRMTR